MTKVNKSYFCMCTAKLLQDVHYNSSIKSNINIQIVDCVDLFSNLLSAKMFTVIPELAES